MKLARYALLMAALAAPVFASKPPKQYEVGTVHAHHFTTTTTSADCVGDGGSMVTCSTIDNTQDGTVYDITLADGTTRSLVHVAFSRNPLKGVDDVSRVQYRIEHKSGLVSFDYVVILDSDGKEGRYTFYHNYFHQNERMPKHIVGPAPVPPPTN